LKQHLWQIHDIGNGRWWNCNQDGCDYKCKTSSHLKQHLWQVHSIGKGKIWKCEEIGCKYQCKAKSDFRKHLQYVHDVGDQICDYCKGNCFNRTVYNDKNVGKVKICRRCYNKITGFNCRAEEEMIKLIERSEFSPYIILKDKIVSHDVCKTRRRPDMLLSSGDLHIIYECDEKQHSQYSPECEWGRLDEIIDEFKDGKIVFVRWNPDYYRPPEDKKRKNRTERTEALLDLTRNILSDPPSEHISIYYMFYNEDNPVIAKRWKTHLIY